MTNNTKDFDDDQRSRRHNMDSTSPSTHLPLILWRFDNNTPSSIMAAQNHRSSAGDGSTSQQIGQEIVDDHPSLFSASLMPSLSSIVEGNNNTMTSQQMTNRDIVNIIDEVMDIIADIDDADDVDDVDKNSNSNKNEENDNLKKKD